MRQFVVYNFLAAIFFLFGERAIAMEHKPTSSADLQSAIDKAAPGDLIKLDAIEYSGNFVISKSGSDGNLIRLIGKSRRDKHTTISSSGGNGFDLKGSFWKIESMEVKGSDLAINVEGDNNIFDSLALNTVAKGVVIKGKHNLVDNCSVKSSGTGVTVETGDKNEVKNTAVTSVEFKKGTCCGSLDSCHIEGDVKIGGDKYKVGSCKGKSQLIVDGCDNVLSSNAFKSGKISPCGNKSDDANVFESQS